MESDFHALIGAGLPPLRANIGGSKAYAERMFNFAEVGALTQDAARDAITEPLNDHGVTIDRVALDTIVDETQCYPYFLQEWGKRAWNAASGTHISARNVCDASEEAVAGLDASFFRVRFDRMTGPEKHYLRAPAELGTIPNAQE